MAGFTIGALLGRRVHACRCISSEPIRLKLKEAFGHVHHIGCSNGVPTELGQLRPRCALKVASVYLGLAAAGGPNHGRSFFYLPLQGVTRDSSFLAAK